MGGTVLSSFFQLVLQAGDVVAASGQHVGLGVGVEDHHGALADEVTIAQLGKPCKTPSKVR